MNIRINYIKAYNIYLKNIQQLLSKYSIRQLVNIYQIDMKDVRLASETNGLLIDNMSPSIIWELRGMDKKERKKWLIKVKKNNWNISQLRKSIRQSKRIDEPKVMINKNIKQEWLNKRKNI